MERADSLFYDNLILSGTKILDDSYSSLCKFYDNLILSGTKINVWYLKSETQFYDNLILSGTKICWQVYTC